MPPRSPISKTPRDRPASRPPCSISKPSAGATTAASSISTTAKIELAFKLYPWEWMFHDAFGERARQAPTRWIEPPWKAILSNKGMLPLLWEMFPGHPNLAAGLFRGRAERNKARLLLRPQAAVIRAKAPISRWSRTAIASPSNRDHMGLRASFARRWRRCRIFPANIRCLEAGWSIRRLAGCRSVRTKIRSPAIRRGFCHTRSFERKLQRAASDFDPRYHAPAAACGIMPQSWAALRVPFGR